MPLPGPLAKTNPAQPPSARKNYEFRSYSRPPINGFKLLLSKILRSVCTGRWSTTRPSKQRVAAILADVQQRGDAAVLEYTARFDGLMRRSWRRWS